MGNIQGIKKYNRFFRKHFGPVFFSMAVILFNICFDAACYQNYQDKMHLLEQMAASDEDNRLDAAVSIIKAEQEHRMEFVKPYGLEHSVQNRYYVMCTRQCMAMAAGSGLVLVIFLAVSYWLQRNRHAQLETYLNSLSRYLAEFWEQAQVARCAQKPEHRTGSMQEAESSREAAENARQKSEYRAGSVQEAESSRKPAESARQKPEHKAWHFQETGSSREPAENACLEPEHRDRFLQETPAARYTPCSRPVLPPALEGLETEADFLNDQLERAAQYLLQAQEKAYLEKEKTKSMVTDISHQLKTPVAALDTCFTILEDPQLLAAERMEFYGRCRNELEGLKGLLDSLLQISRLESGLIQIARKKSLLFDTVIAAVNRIYPKASEKQIGLETDFEPQTEQLAVMQDEKWLCEALVNVLDNALKYSPCGSEIRIGIHKGIRFARIEIADQGIGIPGEDCHKVFRRFYRGSSRWVHGQPGSGVGLYLVREIINGHHGTVIVKQGHPDAASQKIKFPGSIFVIQIPLAL